MIREMDGRGGGPLGFRPDAYDARWISPEASYTISFEHGFVANDRDVFSLRLSNEHAVKGIFVRTRQEARSNAVFRENSQQLKALAFYPAGEIGHEVGRSLQLTQSDLGRDLPGGRSTHDQRISGVRDDPSSRSRQRRIIGKPPEQRMCIEQRAQRGYSRARELARRKRLKELRADAQLALHRSRLTLALYLADRNSTRNRLRTARDDYFLALGSPLNQAGQVRLGLMDCRRAWEVSLANLS